MKMLSNTQKNDSRIIIRYQATDELSFSVQDFGMVSTLRIRNGSLSVFRVDKARSNDGGTD
ncbi:hypothetical protein NWO25_00005 [Enterococcus lactis]|nr:hypothetical protein [Enterococcus lactis]